MSPSQPTIVVASGSSSFEVEEAVLFPLIRKLKEKGSRL